MVLISLNEFRDLPNLKVGDEVEVMVVEKEDREGHLNLSRARPALPVHGKESWKFIKPAKLLPVLLLPKQKVD